MSRDAEVLAILAGCAWLQHVLADVAAVDPPDWWVGAGTERDIVWGERFGGGFDPADVKDVDVAYFDPDHLDGDAEVEAALAARDGTVTWDAKNQAAVHLWYPARYGVEVEPLASVAEGVATWPEPASATAVRLRPDAGGPELELCAPLGVDDLLDGIWRWNPVRCTRREYERRLAAKRPAERWPGVRVIALD